MREIHTASIVETVARLCVEAACFLPEDAEDALARAEAEEQAPLACEMLGQVRENARIARAERIPICQDTELAVVFAEIGQDVHIAGSSFRAAVDEGVRRGYTEGRLRASSLAPLSRVNTGDNTPAILHTELVEGDEIHITVAPKGGGSENKSRLAMLTPAEGIGGAEKVLLETVQKAGGSPCPPLIVGVGIGRTMELYALMAKKALLHPVGQRSADPRCAELEQKWLRAINALGIGAQGLGGTITALAVHLIAVPMHIASYPVAVNLQCHAARHASAVL